MLYQLVDNQKDAKWAISNATINGHIEIVNTLLTFHKGKATNYDEIMRIAAQYGHTEIVKLMLDLGATDHLNSARLSAANGYKDILNLFLDHVHSDYYWILLDSAASNGHIEIVKLLLNRNAQIGAHTVTNASRNGHKAVVELLLDNRNHLSNQECVDLYNWGLLEIIEQKSIIELLFEKHSLWFLNEELGYR